MNVLYWIRRPSKYFKPYVANRVGEIQSRTQPEQWRHVQGKQNSADLSTQGLSVRDLAASRLWWEGPEFLKKSEEHWPPQKVVDDECCPEENNSTTFITEDNMSHENRNFRLNPNRFSDIGKLVRKTAFTRMIAYRILKKQIPAGLKSCSEELTADEKREALYCVIRNAQREVFRDEIQVLMEQKPVQKNSRLAKLTPFIHPDKNRVCNRFASNTAIF